MKLYNVIFESPQEYINVRDAAKKGDPNAVITVNDGSSGKAFELQSEKAAAAVISALGGRLEVIDYDIREIIK